VPRRIPTWADVKPDVAYDERTGLPKEITDKNTEIELVLIPAGEFLMGSAEGDPDEKPPHRVRISKPFYLGKREVTWGEWERIREPRWKQIIDQEGESASRRFHRDRFAGRPRYPIRWRYVEAYLPGSGTGSGCSRSLLLLLSYSVRSEDVTKDASGLASRPFASGWESPCIRTLAVVRRDFIRYVQRPLQKGQPRGRKE
jgi:hypothetical protein